MIHYISPVGIASAWVGNEIEVVRKHGVPVTLHALRKSNQKFFSSAWAQALDAETRTIYPLSFLSTIISVLVAPVLFRSRFFAALFNAFFGRRESLRNRVVVMAHFVVACVWARSLRREPVSHIHSQWINSGGTVGMYGAWLLDVPFSFTGHAADLFRDRVALEDKIRRANFIICISEFHRDFFRKLGAREKQLHIVYCGIDVTHFSPRVQPQVTNKLTHIISTGRLVEKKGFLHLIEACRLLADRGVPFRCTIGGSGPQDSAVRGRIAQLHLESLVKVTGQPLTQEQLPEFMHEGDIYALPCVWAKDGDVDGLPQMLMEAMACGLPAISTKLVGIPDLIRDGETGMLIEPGNCVALADALERLIKNPIETQQLAMAGNLVVRKKFEINTALQPLIHLFEGQIHKAADGQSRAARAYSPRPRKGISA